jgi:alkanesulfonate monooxygenase SsuD/methylene tetrahydromethanopterin reductase-like flavin-dependent oxidoreductase (luciferase family)
VAALESCPGDAAGLQAIRTQGGSEYHAEFVNPAPAALGLRRFQQQDQPILIGSNVADVAATHSQRFTGTSAGGEEQLYRRKSGRLAQLVRAAGLQPAGRGFESLSAHHGGITRTPGKRKSQD